MRKLSNRLKSLAELVSEGYVLADVGTDHGYIPIYLVQEKKIPGAIAMDVGEGPLSRAREHILEQGLGGYIETRLSDGLAALEPGEADSILIAGMGGSLMLRILEEGKSKAFSGKELILQPQSDIPRVRRYLYRQGYEIVRENIVFEEGKYYQMFACDTSKGRGPVNCASDGREPVYHRYGKLLLLGNHPVLKDYLFYKKKEYEKIIIRLMKQAGGGPVTAPEEKRPGKEAVIRRMEQINAELHYIEQALLYWR